MKNNKKIILIGLPATGKTTFLSAFWHSAESQDLANSSIKVETLDGDMEYINKIADQWLAYSEVERTKSSKYKEVRLKLIETKNQQKFEINIPDLSGEIFKEQWENREWTKRYYELVSECDGVLIFLHPNSVKYPDLIEDVNEVIGSNNEQSDINIPEWDKSQATTQVIYVELIQFLKIYLKATLKIALIVSAWDLLSKDTDSEVLNSVTPLHWLKMQLPLLYQFLESNKDLIEYKVYGISAQGGDYSKDSEKLQKIIKPSDRIIVRDDHQTSHDITSPINWLLFNNK